MAATHQSVLVLGGGRVIDPATGHDSVGDVVVEGGLVSAIGPGLAAHHPGASVVDCTGLLVTPGLIDLHVHVYPGLGDFCLHPDQVGVGQAVTTVVDAGTSGVATFGLARRWIDDPAVRTRVLAFMDPCQIYFATKDFICHKLEIANDERNLDADSTAAALEANDDVVVGLKVRACSTTDPCISPFLDTALRVAGGRPVMVHPVVSLAETMSKIWALGVPLPEVVAMATTHPAAVIHRDGELGALRPGRVADVSVLRVDDGAHDLHDGYEVLKAAPRLVPVGCVRAGEWIPADGPRPLIG